MNVVIDCNVLVSASRTGGVCRQVVEHVVRWHTVVVSDPIRAEYEAIAERPKQARFRDALRALVAELDRGAVVVEPANLIFGLRDRQDEVYLATAVSADAILITGNRRDFTLPRYGSVTVLSPRAFLDTVMDRG